MIYLKDINQSNFNDCMSLKRKRRRFVGGAADVLAEAYSFREHSTTYAIYNDETVVGLVTVSDKPLKNNAYSFTNMLIADNHQGKGYAKEAVRIIIEKLKAEKNAEIIKLQVHKSNNIALHIYKNQGFSEVGMADWNKDFIVLSLEL